MNIAIRKKTPYECEYQITRKDHSVELITLETKTFLLHDICHFSVEQNLKYMNGFWGMLSQGKRFDELFGKDNPQTEELRNIEKIVGPVQSIFSGFIPRSDFKQSIEHLDHKMTREILDLCLADIKQIMDQWEYLKVGEQLELEWKDSN